MKYRPEIDGLRAFAVIIVLGFHFFPGKVPGGFIGVDIFFVISGFLITSILIEESQIERFSLLSFYERRIKRLFPALILVLSISMLVGYWGLLANEFRLLGKHLLGGSFFISNLVYLNEVGYFDTDALTKPLLHLWSLGVEEQYYIIWPLVTYVLIKYYAKMSLQVIASIVMLSLFYSIYVVKQDVALGYYSPLSRLWELGVGSLLAFSNLSGQEKQPRANHSLIFGMILITLSIIFFNKSISFPGLAAIPTIFGTALVIYSNQSNLNKLLLGNRLAIAVGKISYPLYLWHWPIISFGYIYYSQFPPRDYRLLGLFLSIIMAIITYQGLEKRIRYAKTKSITVMLLTSTCIVGGVSSV